MINVIANRYAEALFQIGEESQTQLVNCMQELSELLDIFNDK